MKKHFQFFVRASLLLAAAAPLTVAAALSAPIQAKVDARLKQLQAWGSDPAIVSAVKAYNAAPPAEMTNDQWKTLQVLDPKVRAYTKNSVAEAIKAKKDDTVTEAFVSGADGGKVAFLSKPTSWSHKSNPKHAAPMSGKTWIGQVEVDESTGQEQVQVSFPVLDGGKPVGSVVVGLSLAKLK